MPCSRSWIAFIVALLPGCLFVGEKGDGLLKEYSGTNGLADCSLVDCTGRCDPLGVCQECTCVEPAHSCIPVNIYGCCTTDADCCEGRVCRDERCRGGDSCLSDVECSWLEADGSVGSTCDAKGSCVDCLCDTYSERCTERVRDGEGCCRSVSQCQPGQFCRDYACFDTCEDDGECAGRCADLDTCHRCACDDVYGTCRSALVYSGCCTHSTDCLPADTCVQGVCTYSPCGGSSECQYRCAGLGTCDACECDYGVCAVVAVADCCQTDADCDPGFRCNPLSRTCQDLAHSCTWFGDPDLACAGLCGDVGPCQPCRCEMVSALCEPGEAVPGDVCCVDDGDCADADPNTTDSCPAPGAACSHVPKR